MNGTVKRVRRSRAVRGIVAAVVAGVCVIGVAGCTSSTSGEAVPSDGGLFGVGLGSSGTSGAGAAITAAGLDSVKCKANSLPYETYCATPYDAEKNLPNGSTLSLRAGDVLRFPRSDGSDRVCAIGGFVKDAAGDVYAFGGASCAAVSGGTARTTDGYRVGEVRVISVQTSTIAMLPFVKLAASVKGSQTAKSVAPAKPDTVITVHTPHGDLQWAGAASGGLVWSGSGVEPVMKPGDSGSPAVQGTVLVGVADQDRGIITAEQLMAAMSKLGSGVQLAA